MPNAMMPKESPTYNAMMTYLYGDPAMALDAGGNNSAVRHSLMADAGGIVSAGAAPAMMAGGGAIGGLPGAMIGGGIGMTPYYLGLLSDAYGNMIDPGYQDRMTQAYGATKAGQQMQANQPMQYAPQLPYLPRR